MDVTKFQLKRVNPFQGLVIDAETWKDAHNYHRDQQRLHMVAFHKTGIVSGLEVSGTNPQDSSVNISPGLAVDPEGNVIIMPQQQRYRLQTRDKCTVYLVIQFREILTEPYQPPNGGQPTRVQEAFRIQERDQLPSEPYVELARIDFDPDQGAIKDAKNPAKPAVNEINLQLRINSMKPVEAMVYTQPKEIPVPKKPSIQKETLVIGHKVLGDARNDLHINGVRNLARELDRQALFLTTVDDNVDFRKVLGRYHLLYLTGSGQFEVTADQLSALNSFLQSGGTVFGDGCLDSAAGQGAKGAKEFGLAFNRLAGKCNSKLGIVQRGHRLLSTNYVFSETPQGSEPGMLLEGGNIIYSGSDYGCAWEGGHADQPLSRDLIRAAFEMGTNIMVYAKNGETGGR